MSSSLLRYLSSSSNCTLRITTPWDKYWHSKTAWSWKCQGALVVFCCLFGSDSFVLTFVVGSTVEDMICKVRAFCSLHSKKSLTKEIKCLVEAAGEVVNFVTMENMFLQEPYHWLPVKLVRLVVKLKMTSTRSSCQSSCFKAWLFRETFISNMTWLTIITLQIDLQQNTFRNTALETEFSKASTIHPSFYYLQQK